MSGSEGPAAFGSGGFMGFAGVEEEDEKTPKEDWFLSKEEHQTIAGCY